MRKPEVTIALPTFNRSHFLKSSIPSVLSQSMTNFELLILDDASTRKTRAVVESFRDKRIRYYRNQKNIGMLANWNRSIKLSRGQYLLILGDDDALASDFLATSLKAFKRYPRLGFTFSHCNKIDLNGHVIKRWGNNFPPAGRLTSKEYLISTIRFESNLTNSTTTLLRKEALVKTGGFKAEYGANTFDFNKWIKIAENFDVYFIDRVLANYRVHPEQFTNLHWYRSRRQTGKIGTYLEIIGTAAYLLKSQQLTIPERANVARKVVEIDKKLSVLLKMIIPEL